MKLLIVANPVSGRGRGRSLAGELAARLERGGHAADLRFTGAAGDARGLTHDLDPEVDGLLVVGGDGTLNEVLNGLRDPSRIPLGQLASGTANILAHELRLPRDPQEIVRMIDAGRVRRLDMGTAGGRRFLMLVSAGFDAMVVDAVRRRRRETLGYSGYVLPVLSVLRRYRPPRLRVEVDGGAPIHGGWVVVSNMRNYGGLFSVADRACCDSGHLDVCILERATLLPLLHAAVRAITVGVSGMTGATYLTGQRVRIDSDDPVAVEVDGDYLGTTPVEIGLTPRHVPFWVPETT